MTDITNEEPEVYTSLDMDESFARGVLYAISSHGWTDYYKIDYIFDAVHNQSCEDPDVLMAMVKRIVEENTNMDEE